ncbi:MAG: peptidylprolyl isomerase [Bryobacteraceae bacterium]
MRYCAIAILLLGGFASAADVQPALVEEIVCKVNGDIVTSGELEKDRRDAEAQFRQQGLTGQALRDAVNDAARNALQKRIDSLLLIAKGKELDIKVDNDVNKQIADIQRRSGISDPDKFQQFVHEKLNMPFEDYKNELKNQILIDRVIRQEVSGKMHFKREDLEKYYNGHKSEFQREERVFLSDIYISTDGKTPAELAVAEKKAKGLAGRAKGGDKFTDLAEVNSDDPNAQNGGQMPPFKKGELLKQIEDVVWSQPRGFVSDPIQLNTPGSAGFYIFRVDDHQKSGLADFEEVQNEVENKVMQPKIDPAIRTYLTTLREQAFLEIKPGYVDTGAAPGKDTAWIDPAQLKPETVTKEEVAARKRHKKLLGVLPIPGTTSAANGTSSSR